jgi:anti-anti-sigma factor
MDERRSNLAIEQRGEPPRVTLALAGELDIDSAPRLHDALTKIVADDVRALTLDLSRLAFIDSSGLAAIVYASRLCERRGCELELVRGAENVQRVFDVSGLGPSLPFRTRASSHEA